MCVHTDAMETPARRPLSLHHLFLCGYCHFTGFTFFSFLMLVYTTVFVYSDRVVVSIPNHNARLPEHAARKGGRRLFLPLHLPQLEGPVLRQDPAGADAGAEAGCTDPDQRYGVAGAWGDEQLGGEDVEASGYDDVDAVERAGEEDCGV